jgi:hypothetical protein
MVEDDPDLAVLRRDRRGGILAVASDLAGCAGWRSLRAFPTRAGCAARTGLSERTVTRAWRWLEARGFLKVLEPGTTPRFRPGVLHALRPDKAGENLAREWLLTCPGEPPVQETVTPPRSLTETPIRRRRARARQPGLSQQPATTRAGCPTKGAMLAGAEWLRRHSPVLWRISGPTLRRTLRRYWRAGDGPWTCQDVLYALDHLYDGTPHTQTDRVRDPLGWISHRLGHWHDAHGDPLPGHSADLRRRAAAHRAAVAAQLAALGPRRPAAAVTRRPPASRPGEAAQVRLRLAAAADAAAGRPLRGPVLARALLAAPPEERGGLLARADISDAREHDEPAP